MAMAAGWQLRPAAMASTRISSQSTVSWGRYSSVRSIHVDHRERLSRVWVPAPDVREKDTKVDEESHAKLVRAGFFRQAHSGLFHMLPLGLRVQNKIEAIVDKHMKGIGASRVSMSSISSAKLWSQSGRLETSKSELFQFEDRKKAKYLLSPTHEEEITELVSQNVITYRSLPLLLYQITRKYRDEMRPRYGILRSREFIMKDLYSFDATVEEAMETYAQVRGAYAKIFAEMKLPVHSARASSGDMGGDLSHEYHLAASLGEDYVSHCNSCDHTANIEVLKVPAPKDVQAVASTVTIPEGKGAKVWRGISEDRRQFVSVWYPETTVDSTTGVETTLDDSDIDVEAVRSIVPDLDTSLKDAAQFWDSTLAKATEGVKPRLVNLVDWRLLQKQDQLVHPLSWPSSTENVSDRVEVSTLTADPNSGKAFNFAKARTGDDCPECGAHGALTVDKAIELGHTFYLGKRYTDPLGVQLQGQKAGQKLVPVMGCYGIGLSRILGAAADHLVDERGLNWPRAIAPYEVVVLPMNKKTAEESENVYDALAGTAEEKKTAAALDVLLDDRDVSLPWKLKDADLTGYPVVVVVGKAWLNSLKAGADASNGLVEVQCRQLKVKQDVPLTELHGFVQKLLDQL